MALVFMFPGQSSRYEGMLLHIASLHPAARFVLDRASDLLGRDLAHSIICDEGHTPNRDIQIGVFVANHMFLSILEAEAIRAEASLGLSLGEWNHLVEIGAISFEDALGVVDARGRAYDEGPPGAMASFFPIDIETLRNVVDRARGSSTLELSNFNSPRQTVISGDRDAVHRALQMLEEDHFVQGVIIEDRIPMHCSLFESVATRFQQTLRDVAFRPPRRPYLPNVLGHFEDRPTNERFQQLLKLHVSRPVLWRESIDHLLSRYPDACLVEVGPKAVLCNLFDRKWHPRITKVALDSKEDARAHIQHVLQLLRRCEVEREVA